jgi:glutamate synthase domain-containing protein 2
MLKWIDAIIPRRYWVWAISMAGVWVCLLLPLIQYHQWFLSWPFYLFAFVALMGAVDFFQTTHAIRRNYPVMANFRFLFEMIRPELRQYFIESDTEELPFSRAQRSMVYQRAKTATDKRPFGTQLNVYASNYEWMNHSMRPVSIDSADFRVEVGGPDCTQPYAASVFNISAMSFGALSANAIMALNEGARRGGFYHDTGEGSISQYHLPQVNGSGGGDLVWEIGSGYFGCRDNEGHFDEKTFAANAARPQVKMIEIKLSQGAKPGQGGVLPGAKVTAEIAAARGVPAGKDCISPSLHSAFSTPIELLEFIVKLRNLSGGKPVGFKFCIGHPWEWFAIVKAMLKTGITPDFIVVDGGEGGTGAAPVEFSNNVGAPLREALMLVHNTLIGVNLRDRIKIGAAGKIISAFDIARAIALGADWCNSARGYMFSIGCLQAQTCHTDHCPSGVATQDKLRQRALVVPDKAERVYQFHKNTLKAFKDLLAAAGLNNPEELGPEHIIVRLSPTEVRSLATMHLWVRPGELLHALPEHRVYKAFWQHASADSFEFAKDLKDLRYGPLE